MKDENDVVLQKWKHMRSCLLEVALQLLGLLVVGVADRWTVSVWVMDILVLKVLCMLLVTLWLQFAFKSILD